jgi:hypothetical protein
MRNLVFPVLTLVSIAGCSSFRTTAIDRLEDDVMVVNPDEPLNGIPVSLRIPTHLELSVIETTFWRLDGTEATLRAMTTGRANRSVTHTVVSTEKIFLVDPVRPISGLENYGFTFTSGGTSPQTGDAGKGYLRDVSYKADDTTIKDSAALLARSIGFVNALRTSSGAQSAVSADVITTDRVIAFGRFDINSPCFEQDMAGFLECHMNAVAKDSNVVPVPVHSPEK